MSTANFIVPGPDVQPKIDRVAEKLAFAPQLREKLLEQRRDEFSFVLEGHEFYPYYISKLDEAKAKGPPAKKAPATADAAKTAQQAAAPLEPEQTETALQRALKQARDASAIVADPHPDLYSVAMTGPNAALPALEFDIMQQAAAYAAKLGDEFYELLVAKHMRDPAFDFLRSDHPRNRCFQALRSAYRRILDGPPAERLELESGKSAVENVLEVCNEKKAFREAEHARKRAAQLSEHELRQRLEWSSFKVLGNFTEADLGITVAVGSSYGTGGMPAPVAPTSSAASGAAAASIPVVEEYNPQGRTATAGSMQMVDGKTGAMVSADDAGAHMRSQLVASKFDEDRARYEKRMRGDSNLADDAELERNLAAKFGRQAREEASFDVDSSAGNNNGNNA